jgi:hypothetical protein
MQGLLSVVGVGAGLAFMVASGWMNVLFMVGQARSQHSVAPFALASIAITLSNALLPFYIKRAWDGRRWLAVAIGLVVFPICLVVSLASAVGFTASNRGAVVGGRDAVTASYEAAKGRRDDLQAQLAGVKFARDLPASVEADSAAMKKDRLWASSNECADATAPASREFCKRFEFLKGELKASTSKGALREQIGQVEARMETLRGQGAGLDSDPQAGFVSRWLGVSRVAAQSGRELLIAILLELGAAFLPYLALADAKGWHFRATPRESFATGRAVPVTIDGEAVEVEPKRRNRWIEIAEKNGALRRD